MRRRLAFPLLLVFSVSPLLAAEKKPLTVDDMWAVQRVGTPVLSPDGKSVAYTVSAYDMEENRSNGDVWVVPLSGGSPRRLTANKASDGSPAWGPDGKRIAFVSKRDGDTAAQLYVIPIDGGEPERITEMPIGISNPKWLPDGKRIAFVSHVVAGAESPADTKKALEAREKNKVKARVTENRLFRFWDRWLTDGEFPHIFVVDVGTKKVTDLLPGSKRLFDLQEGTGHLDVSPDGKWIAFEANATPQPYEKLNRDVFLVPTAGGEVRDLTAANLADDSDPVFSPDGKAIAYGLEVKADGWPDSTRLAVIDVSSGHAAVLTEPFDVSAGGWAWSPDGRTIVFHAESRARTNLYAIPRRAGRRRRFATAERPRAPTSRRTGRSCSSSIR
jgi:Tol biopolymer transport system component